MHDIKLVLTDVDETVAPLMQHVVSDAVRQAIIDTENYGVTVAAVTGRAYVHAKSTMNILGIEGPSVFEGGASVVDTLTGEILWKRWIDAEILRQVVPIYLQYCNSIVYDTTFVNTVADQIDPQQITEDAPLVFGIVRDPDQIPEMLAKLAAVSEFAVVVNRGVNAETGETGQAVHITHKLADKYHGVQALINIIGASKDHILAIGDGMNDLPLFECASVKVAMGNATDELKQAADYVVGTFDQDGFAEAMHKYVLHK